MYISYHITLLKALHRSFRSWVIWKEFGRSLSYFYHRKEYHTAKKPPHQFGQPGQYSKCDYKSVKLPSKMCRDFLSLTNELVRIYMHDLIGILKRVRYGKKGIKGKVWTSAQLCLFGNTSMFGGVGACILNIVGRQWCDSEKRMKAVF